MESTPVPSPDGNVRCTVLARLGEPSVITVSGDADLHSIGPVGEAVRTALDHHPHLVFDLGGVAFADSSFLNVLLQARNTSLERGGSVRLLRASSQVRRLLDLTGAGTLFPATTDEQLKQP